MSDEGFSVGRVVGYGLLSGAVFGVGMGLWFRDLWMGMALGVLFGVWMGFAMRRLYGSTAFKGLSWAERRQIVRTMRRGEPVTDPRLAPAALAHARAVLAVPFKPGLARVVFGILVLVGAVTVVWRIAEGAWSGLLVSSWPLVVGLLLLFVLVPLNERRRARVARSASATGQKWSQSTRD